jgi:glyoxylase-like metal-dependent hydrolase (beta-lactamase superfamily II)
VGLRDGIEETADQPPGRPRLVYPFETTPEPGSGEAVEVAPGVLWLRQPLGGALQFINVWALADGGWALVDTGIQTHDSAQAWRTALKGVLGGKPVTRMIVTHLHPDHIGLAGWITRKFKCRLWMTRLEYFQCRMLVADTGREAPEDGIRFFRAAGWDDDALDNYKARFGGFGKMIYQLPDSYRRMQDGDAFEIGGRTWRVVTGNGHSPEHACLYCPELKLLISGDQVLPRISSNVSVFPTEPDADPLTDWLTSCAKLKAAVPDDVLVLPAHNDPFHGLHARLDHLIAGHERSLGRLEKLLAAGPRRAVDVFGALFARPIGPDLLGMATGESVAHINCLIGRGLAVREEGDDGVAWYRAA